VTVETSSYETQDMAFASYLVCQGCTISKVSRSGRRVMWSFQIPVDRLAALEAEWPSSLESKYFSLYQTLKTQIRTM
jgi:hypothetical protein